MVDIRPSLGPVMGFDSPGWAREGGWVVVGCVLVWARVEAEKRWPLLCISQSGMTARG